MPETMRLSPAERQVIAAMRYDQKSGEAIYNYALRVAEYDDYPDSPDPFHPD